VVEVGGRARVELQGLFESGRHFTIKC
jgi:hypothetical protein